MVIEKSARSRKYSPMSIQSLFFITFFLKHLSNTCVLCIIYSFFESSQLTDLAILFLFWISNIFLIIFHIIIIVCISVTYEDYKLCMDSSIFTFSRNQENLEETIRKRKEKKVLSSLNVLDWYKSLSGEFLLRVRQANYFSSFLFILEFHYHPDFLH